MIAVSPETAMYLLPEAAAISMKLVIINPALCNFVFNMIHVLMSKCAGIGFSEKNSIVSLNPHVMMFCI